MAQETLTPSVRLYQGGWVNKGTSTTWWGQNAFGGTYGMEISFTPTKATTTSFQIIIPSCVSGSAQYVTFQYRVTDSQKSTAPSAVTGNIASGSKQWWQESQTYTNNCNLTINVSNISPNTKYYVYIFANDVNSGSVGFAGNNPDKTGKIQCYNNYSTTTTTTTYYAYLKYNLQGGTWNYQDYDEYSSTSSSTFNKNVTSIEPTRDGYTFQGWATSSTSTVVAYEAGDSITLYGSTGNGTTTNLYAIWTTNSSGGGGGGGGTASWSWKNSYATKLGSMQNGGNTNFSFSLSVGQVGYCPFSPNVNGTITVYTTGSDDTYGYLVNENATLYASAVVGSQLFKSNTKNIYTSNDDKSTSNSNFSYSYDVSANTTYNVVFAGYDGLNESISGTLYFTFTPDITSWQAPVNMTSISGSTTHSTTSVVNKYNAGYVQYTTPGYAGKVVFETTSGSTSPNYYSYLSTSTLSAGSGTSRSGAVTGAIVSDDDGGAQGYDTLISYACNASTNYYWYVNGDWASSGTYSIPWKLTYHKKYTITYNANGGTGAPSSQSFYADDTTVSIPSTTPTYTNYIFLGWSTDASATSATYTAGSSPTLSAQNYTLYAVWEPIKYYITVEYHTNDGSNIIFATKNYNSTAINVPFNIITEVPTREKFDFLGWGLSADDTEPNYQKGDTNITKQGNPSQSQPAIYSLYAIWKRKGNVYYYTNNTWYLCETYIYKNGSWVPCQFSYSPDGTSWEQ